MPDLKGEHAILQIIRPDGWPLTPMQLREIFYLTASVGLLLNIYVEETGVFLRDWHVDAAVEAVLFLAVLASFIGLIFKEAVQATVAGTRRILLYMLAGVALLFSVIVEEWSLFAPRDEFAESLLFAVALLCLGILFLTGRGTIDWQRRQQLAH